MGRRGGRGGMRGRGQRGGHVGATRGDWKDIVKHNVNFEKYYNALDVVPEAEREQFWAALRRELPNSFRFTGSKGHALAVQQRLVDQYIPEITKVTFDGQTVEPPTQLEWFPEKLAWQMSTPKNVVRKFPPFASFQKFLVSETSVGNISRQEVVSMIPPLLMDIKPWHIVLDLCAAPGSKSAQLCEAIHAGEEVRIRDTLRRLAPELGREISPDGAEVEAERDQAGQRESDTDDGRATGLLICNDVDNRRAHMLVHQVKRLNSPNLIVTNHDATLFPSIRLPSHDNQSKRYLKFDRVLADVPCSGDGTARKNPSVWMDWTAGNGLGLHVTQQRILVRALQMLKVGGRVVYSTCSLNPVENEAVVAGAIGRCGGMSKVCIVDCSHELPGFRRVSGLQSWTVMDKQARMYSSFDEVAARQSEPGDESLKRVVEDMFPPKPVGHEEQRIPLERCIRVYPHLQDTGGFFIAVIEKKEEIRARPEYQASACGARTDPSAPIKDGTERMTENEDRPEGLQPLENAVNPESKVESTPADSCDSAAVCNKLPPQSLTKRPLEDDEANSSAAKRTKAEPCAAPKEATNTMSEQKGNTSGTIASVPRPEKKRQDQPYEEPFKYLDPKHQVLEDIFAFYNIAARFPRDCFMVRNASGEPAKAIYYTSPLARDLLQANEGKGMKFVHCGVKIFMKQDAQGQDICRWRIQSEGLPIVEPWVGEERIVRLYKRPTLHILLKEMFPKVSGDGWRELGEIGERVRDISMGCCVLRVESSDDGDGFRDRLVLPLWRSISSLNLMLPKEERRAMLLRLFNDNSELIDHSKQSFIKQNRHAQGGDLVSGEAAEEDAIVIEDRADADRQADKYDVQKTVEEDHATREDVVASSAV